MSEIRTDTINNASGDNDSGIDLSTNDVVAVKIAGSEKARVDSSGNLLVGGTTTNHQAGSSQEQLSYIAGGYFAVSRSGNDVAFFNRQSSDGSIINIRKDGTTVGSIGSAGGGTEIYLTGNVSGTAGIYMANSGRIIPMLNAVVADNAVDMGAPTYRFDDIYATNPNISVSDRNEKQDIEELTEAEQRVAVACKGLMRKYRWRDSVAKKGDNARTHFGIIAQDLQDAFTAEGLDASDYAMFTSNTWWEKEISVDAVEADEENGIEAKDAYTYMDTKEEETEGYTERTRLGVRYSELLAFIISAI